MHYLTRPMAAAILVAAPFLVSCQAVKPAGTLGYLIDGNPRNAPVPTNFHHVPPPRPAGGPLRMQMEF
ncbi:MAG: hypothetical protein H7A55_13865 [Verrucomicrobiaceae bacterium]|nr:hypothetical protein [Verrucomicrobiaceae bacterium]